ncbi:MAG: M20/M25/M40 family metallo-hydrolase [Planctomycetes bacterium]|nr:M20/M25/M40 family metallo-hydrolase [Planctomycetota bacterium]
MSESAPKPSSPPSSPTPARRGVPLAPRAGALAVGLALCAGIGLLSAWRLEPPAVVRKDAPQTEFSGERALGYLKGLIGPGGTRMVGSPGNARARDYLVKTLGELGYEPQIQKRFLVSRRFACSGTLSNVLAELPGSDPTATAVLLSAHYDCVGAGDGAGDDGSGVAALLEIARALKAGPPLKRSVIFLFSDAEESGLLGADAFTGVWSEVRPSDGRPAVSVPLQEPHPWFKRVGCVINLEARGSRGPSLMFQTGPKSTHLIEALATHAPRPVLGSSFATVYELLPNDTDLSAFRDRGVPGLNFAFIGGVEHYHTSYDDLAHLDPRSVQHHGSNVLPLVKALADAGEASSKPSELVYFDLLSLVVVRWPAEFSVYLSALALVLIAIVFFGLTREGHRDWALRGLAWGGLGVLACVLLVIGFGQAAASWRWPEIAFPADPAPWIVLASALALSGGCLAAQLAWRGGFWGTWVAVWASQAAVGIGLSLSPYVGFCYIFVVPALVAGVAGLVAMAVGRERPAVAALAGLLPLMASALLLAPLFVLVYQALGLQVIPLPELARWPALAIFPALTLLGVVPLLPLLALRGSGRGALLFTALGFALLAGTVAPGAAVYAKHPARQADPQAAIPGRSGDVPRRVDLVFNQSFEDEGTGAPLQIDASWLAFTYPVFDPYEERTESYPRGRGLPLPPFLTSATSPFDVEVASPWVGLPPAYRAQAAPLSGAQPPILEGLKIEVHGEGRLVRFRLRSPRRARMLGLFFTGSMDQVGSIRIAGQLAQRWRKHWCFNAPPEGLEFEIFLKKGKTPSVPILVIDAEQGLPKTGRVLRELRDSVGSATSDRADLHVHSATYKL